MDEPVIKPPNPFVGPRAILENEPFFGREDELNNLIDQLYAERIVLMYSPSGAGKTSLINAGLLPQLKTSFNILPILRLNRQLPDTLNRGDDINRYSASVLSSLYAPGDPPDWQLSAYPFGESPVLLIFDQFEEIITLDPADVEQKKNFFMELSGQLKRSNLWALFALREDYLAALDPYRLILPGQLRSRFRLDLFTRQQAVEVMVKTAETRNVHFHRQAAEGLASILSESPVGDQPEGASPQIGQFVEPVHVQLVCFDLWEKKLQPGGREITPDMIEETGGVDEALARFYASSLEKIAAEKGVPERRLRDLFENKLITKNNIRAQVQLGDMVGLKNAVDALKDTYLLRSDVRHGKIWYELAHDRLINPIRNDNRAWFEKHSSPHLSGAIAWERAGRQPDMLLRGAALDRAEAWKRDNPDEPVTELEKAYVDQSIKARAEEEKIEKKRLEDRNRQQRRWIIGLASMVFIMGFLIILNFKNYQTALENLDIYNLLETTADVISAQATQNLATADAANAKATEVQRQLQTATAQAQATEFIRLKEMNRNLRANRLAEDSRDTPDISRQLRLLLAAEAVNISRALDPADQPALARQVLITLLASPSIQPLRGHTQPVKSLAVSPDGIWLATSGDDGAVRLWNQTAEDPGKGLLLTEEYFGPVSSLAFSPDGAWLVFGTLNGCLVLSRLSEEVESGYGISDYFCQGDRQIQNVIISSDSRWLAVTSLDHDLWIYDLNNSGDLSSSLLSLPGHGDSVTDLTFSPDSRWLATGSLDGAIRVWEMSALGNAIWEELLISPPQADLTLTGQAGAVTALDTSPDSRWLASGSQDGFVRLWDFQAENPQAEPYILDNQAIAAEAIEFSPDGQLLAIAGSNLTRLWDIQKLSQKYPGESDPASVAAFNPIFHKDQIRDLAFSPGEGSPYLATGSENGVVRLVDLVSIRKALQEGKTPAEIALIDIPMLGHQSQINDLAFSPDGQTLFTASDDSTIIEWPLAGLQQPIPTILEHPKSVNSAAFSPDGKRLATASEDGAARVWRVASRQEPPLVLLGHAGSVRSTAFSPDGERLVTASEDATARIWDLNLGTELVQLRGHESFINSAAFSPDGERVVTASDDGTARIWDVSSGEELMVLRGHESYVNSAAFSPDGAWVVTASDDGTARMWDGSNGEELAVLRGHESYVNSAVFSPDGEWLATGSDDGTIRLWNLKNTSALGENPIILPDLSGAVSALAFDPTGRWLASGNSAGIGRLWDLQARDPATEFVVLPAHKDWINAIAISPDGESLVTASNDGTAFLWPIDAASLIDLACQAAGPQASLTQAEWELYLPGEEYDPTCP